MDLLRGQLENLFTSFSRVLDDGTPSVEVIESLLIGAERVHLLIAALVHGVPGIENTLPQVEFLVSSLNGIVLAGASTTSIAFASPLFYS